MDTGNFSSVLVDKIYVQYYGLYMFASFNYCVYIIVRHNIYDKMYISKGLHILERKIRCIVSTITLVIEYVSIIY